MDSEETEGVRGRQTPGEGGRSGLAGLTSWASFCLLTFSSSVPPALSSPSPLLALLAPSHPSLPPRSPRHALRRRRSPRQWYARPFLACFRAFPNGPMSTDSAPQSRSSSPVGSDSLTLRALVSTKDAGVIIGKAGKNVAELRDQTGVKAGVSKVIPGVHERVLTVTGTVEGVAKVCNYQIARLPKY